MKVVLSVLLVVSLTGCATYHPDVIHPYETQRMSHLSDATVLSVRPVTIDGMQTGAGASVGAIAGGIAAANAASNRADARTRACLQDRKSTRLNSSHRL